MCDASAISASLYKPLKPNYSIVQFSHLQYKAEINQKVFGNKLKKLSTAERTEEELYSLSCKYCINKTELQHLRAYYVTFSNICLANHRFHTEVWEVSNKLLVNKNAHRPNAPIILEEREFFGEFQILGVFEVINISAIDRNVGFLKMPNNELYIIDRENRVKFR
ncbi:unnamed protein product [Rhizophagus irregularis]|nr:unnamed protein product [Rhizophagus irregularis]